MRGADLSPATMPEVTSWRCVPFTAMTPAELYAVLRARQRVFVVEQACAYGDLDGIDPHCHHLWTAGPDGDVAAYLRIVPPGVKYQEPSLGRIVTSARVRRSGLGRALVREGIERLEARYGRVPIRIAAQRYLREFYAGFGFAPTGHDFDEDGIAHSEMLRLPRRPPPAA